MVSEHTLLVPSIIILLLNHFCLHRILRPNVISQSGRTLIKNPAALLKTLICLQLHVKVGKREGAYFAYIADYYIARG